MLVIVVLLAIVACLLLVPSRMTFVRATNGVAYNVRRSKDATEAAERLAVLQRECTRFLRDAAAKFPASPVVARILRRWNGTIAEVPNEDEVAFSLDKRTISVCLRSKETGQLESLNASMFVLLHELAHIATPHVGHTPEFWRNMKTLLEMAHRLGYYKDDDHRPDSTFCGHPLGMSPMTCVRERTCSSEL